jgi:transporter family-2 protein
MDEHRAPALTFVALAFAGGALLPIQAIVNGRLGGSLGAPFVASAAQNVIGTLAALLLAVAFWPTRLSLAQVAATPAWAWTGGLMGMAYVLVGVIAAPRLGATSLMAAVIFGQLVCALVLDQLGVAQVRRPIDASAIVGVTLLLAGSILVLRRG